MTSNHRIWQLRMVVSPVFLRFLAAIAVLAAGVGVKRLADSYAPEMIYRKDFIQEYCMAKAVVDGDDPYAPMPVLVERYFGKKIDIPWEHPAPHPPLAAMLSVPIGFFGYERAALIWILCEIAVLAVAVELLANWWSEGRPHRVTRLQKIALVLMCLGFGPTIHDLWHGQFSMVLLLTLIFAWLALRKDHDWAGGAFLGFAVALKLAAWPVGLLLMLKFRWKAVLAAGAIALGLNVAAAGVIGFPTALKYYTEVGPLVARQNHLHTNNYSLWTIGGRLFSPENGKFGDEYLVGDFLALGLTPAPHFDDLVTRLLPPLALVLALVFAWRCRQFDSAFGILVCAGLALNPVAWDHYQLMAAIPIVVVFRRLRDLGFPRRPTTFAAFALALTVFPFPAIVEGTCRLWAVAVVRHVGLDHVRVVPLLPFAPGLVTYVLLVSLTTWIVLLVNTDDREAPNGGTAPATTTPSSIPPTR